MKSHWLALGMLCLSVPISHGATDDSVSLIALPDGAIQPRIGGAPDGTTQVVYFKGEPGGGDLFHSILRPGTTSLEEPVRINSIPNSAVATGTIRGAQIAVGRDGHLHVVWNGSMTQKGDRPPLFYTRMKSDGKGSEEQRPLSGDWLMDGGGAVAADEKGGVYVFFHGGEGHGEESRRVILRVSQDDGKTFAPERVISPDGLGVCACCGMQAYADERGRIFVIYRTASEGGKMRDIATLFSGDGGGTWRHAIVDRWEINACPMSSMCITKAGGTVAMAWERDGQIFLGRWDAEKGAISTIQALPGAGKARKHPSLGSDAAGNLLVAWTEGTGWNRGGGIAWQLLDRDLKAKGGTGHAAGLPVWGFVSVISGNGGFAILH